MDKRFKRGVLLATLTLCAFFLAQGATALLGARVLGGDPDAANAPRKRRPTVASPITRHDPGVILRRNIFNSELGDLTQVQQDEQLVDGEIILEDEEAVDPCAAHLRLRGTAVVPGDLERSLAVIMGSDRQAQMYQGGAEVEGSPIRAIHADSVFLQTGGTLCRIAMFDPDGPPRPLARPVREAEKKKDTKKDKKKRAKVDRNAGLSEEEIDAGIEKVNENTFNISRTMLNKVLDSAGRLIGIAAVTPKMENGKSVGMQIRGIRTGTLLEKLGIKNKDVLESVNGESLASTDAALGAYTALRTSEKVVIAINRNGTPTELTYNLN